MTDRPTAATGARFIVPVKRLPCGDWLAAGSLSSSLRLYTGEDAKILDRLLLTKTTEPGA